MNWGRLGQVWCICLVLGKNLVRGLLLVEVEVGEESVEVVEDDGWKEFSERETLGILVFQQLPIQAIESKREVLTTAMGMKGRAIIALGVGIEVVSDLSVGHWLVEADEVKRVVRGTSVQRSLDGTVCIREEGGMEFREKRR